MAFGNNRSASRPRATFQVAGGTIVKYSHAYLSGQISQSPGIDTIDVSKALRLNSTYLSARPNQDSSFQEILVDGSVIVVTNNILAGTMDLEVLRTTGLVGTGDFIAALQLVKTSKDSIGGVITHIETINGKRIVTIFYGVSIKSVPDLIKAGNAVVPYPVQLLYAGWVQGVGGADTDIEQAIWAVGNQYGLRGVYRPYDIQSAENANDFYGGAPLGTTNGVPAGAEDTQLADQAGVVPTSPPAGGYPNVTPSASDPNPTW